MQWVVQFFKLPTAFVKKFLYFVSGTINLLNTAKL